MRINTVMISPIHSTTPTPNAIVIPANTNSWTIDLKIDIFYAQVDGWHLEMADRIINGWKSESGEDFINGVCPPKTLNAGTNVNHIPDSAYAMLRHVDDTTAFHFDGSRWYVDPHNMVRHLRQHLTQFTDELRNSDQTDLRANFEKAFDMKILDKET